MRKIDLVKSAQIPRFDGSTNRYVDATGKRVDLRVSPGDFPTPARLSNQLGSTGPICWSPTDGRIAVIGAGALCLLTETPAGWAETILAIDRYHPRDAVWSRDGKRLFVAFDGIEEPERKSALVVTFDERGTEVGRFEVPAQVTRIRLDPNGVSLLVTSEHGPDNGTHRHDPKGNREAVVWRDGEVDFDPSGQLMVRIKWGKRVTDLEGAVLFEFEGPYVWLGPREIGVYLQVPKWGLYRVLFGADSVSAPQFIVATERIGHSTGGGNLRVSPDGRFVGLLSEEPTKLDLHDVTTGTRIRRLKFPRGNSHGAFTFGPGGRIAGVVNWQKVVHVFDTEPKFGVIARTAASEQGPRKETQKFFATAELARREGDKQVAALVAKEFALESIDPPANDDEVERLELVRRIHAGLPSVSRTALVPERGARVPWLRYESSPGLGGSPTCPSCKAPMTCLAEVDLDALPEGLDLRGSGLVQVFSCTSPESNCEVITEAWLPGSGRSRLARLRPGPASKPVQGSETAPSRIAIDVPHLRDLKVVAAMKAPKALKMSKLNAEEWPGPIQGDKVGGFPAWVQEPEYPTCPTCAKAMTDLILQMASSRAVQFGDAGVAYVLRCASHPEALEIISQSC